MTEHVHHHHQINEKSVKLLVWSFAINMILSIAEIIGGIVSGSVALVGDALHNTSDALSILIAIIAFKIGNKKASAKYTYGFKRAEVIGGFVNLILLFLSGSYLLIEGIGRIIKPEQIEAMMIVWISVWALLVDVFTAKISHHGAHHNSNMKMVFVHNLADVFGSVGVIFSGFCVMWFGIYAIDGVIAVLIAIYMIVQSVITFPKIVNILMDATPDDINVDEVKKCILKINDVKDVYHIHLWNISEHNVAMECHVVSDDETVAQKIARKMKKHFKINHCNVQVEKNYCGEICNL